MNYSETSVTSTVPIMQQYDFAALSGLRQDQLRGQIQRGNIPTIRFGGRKFINTAKYMVSKELTESQAVVRVPIMTAESFAKSIGMSPQWVNEKLNEGILPKQKIGRLNCINIVKLFQICLINNSSALPSMDERQ